MFAGKYHDHELGGKAALQLQFKKKGGLRPDIHVVFSMLLMQVGGIKHIASLLLNLVAITFMLSLLVWLFEYGYKTQKPSDLAFVFGERIIKYKNSMSKFLMI